MPSNIFVECKSNFNEFPKTLGILDNYTFSAKDLFDLKGHIKSNGHKGSLNKFEPSSSTSPIITALMREGAKLVGLTNCDEFFYSLTGIESSFQQPENWINTKLVPGGSSSGAAASVGFDLADFALGSDTGGSIRVPASFCSLFGIRPTHGRIPTNGMTALAPSLDTLGWLTKKPELLSKVGQILLKNYSTQKNKINKIIIIEDLFKYSTQQVSADSKQWIKILEAHFNIEAKTFSAIDFESSIMDFQIIQGWEAKLGLVKHVKKHRLKLRKNIKERIDFADSITKAEFENANKNRKNFKSRIDALIEDDCVAIFPTTPMPALNKSKINEELSIFRKKIHNFTCIAGLTGRPQISLPLKIDTPQPFGISILGSLNKDEQLISLTEKIYLEKR